MRLIFNSLEFTVFTVAANYFLVCGTTKGYTRFAGVIAATRFVLPVSCTTF